MSHNKNLQLVQYAVLIAILVGGFYSILLFKDNRNLQIFSILIMSVAYMLWGISYHVVEKTFHIKIVVEYTLISLTVATLLIILLSLL